MKDGVERLELENEMEDKEQDESRKDGVEKTEMKNEMKNVEKLPILRRLDEALYSSGNVPMRLIKNLVIFFTRDMGEVLDQDILAE